jgi:hypothetical protein
MGERCSFCGATNGPFSKVEGLFAVLMCADCQPPVAMAEARTR